MSRVALVFPYFRTRTPTEMLFPPLGAATLAAQLRRLGVQTRVFDCTFATFEQLREDLTSYRPDIVGVYSMVSLTRNALRVAEMVRTSLPESLLVAGGPLPTVFPGRYRQFDAVFRGEADVSFPRFCRDYFEHGAARATMGELPLETYPGLFVQQRRPAGGQPDRAPPRERAGVLPPARQDRLRSRRLPEGVAAEDRDQAHLHHRHAWAVRTAATSAPSRSSATWCAAGTSMRCSRRSSRSGRSATTASGSPTTSSPWTSATWRSSAGAWPGGRIGWSCLSRANGIGPATVRRMKEAGCRRVYLGLESGSQSTLRAHEQADHGGPGHPRRTPVS